MSQFIIKLVNFFANELITKRLANSRSFQQFALKTHDKVQAAKGIVQDPAQTRQALKEAGKVMQEGFGRNTGMQQSESTSNQFRKFKEALKEEVARDWGSGNKRK